MFPTRGPATVNDRSPTVERLADGTSKRLVLANRNVRQQQERLVTPKYRGALPSITLCMSAQRLCSRSALGRAASEGRQERR